MNATIPLFCIGSFLLVFLALLVFALVTARQRKQEVADAAAQLGFTPLTDGGAELLDRLAKLHRPQSVRKVYNVYSKPFGSETYYIFDSQVDTPHQNSDSETGTNSEYGNIGVLSPYLDLPSFMLIPRFPGMPGGLGGIMDGFMMMAATRAGLTEFTLVTPEFSSKYQLFVKVDARNEQVFSETVLDWIARQDQIVARGEDDFLLYNRYNLRMRNKKETRQISELVEGARQLCDFLVTKKG